MEETLEFLVQSLNLNIILKTMTSKDVPNSFKVKRKVNVCHFFLDKETFSISIDDLVEVADLNREKYRNPKNIVNKQGVVQVISQPGRLQKVIIFKGSYEIEVEFFRMKISRLRMSTNMSSVPFRTPFNQENIEKGMVEFMMDQYFTWTWDDLKLSTLFLEIYKA
jgi:hypothetical protein